MERYANLGGSSGVDAYEYDANSITVRFKDGAEYLYTVESAGYENIANMKTLADAGQGLNTYINQHVKKIYERILKEPPKPERPVKPKWQKPKRKRR